MTSLRWIVLCALVAAPSACTCAAEVDKLPILSRAEVEREFNRLLQQELTDPIMANKSYRLVSTGCVAEKAADDGFACRATFDRGEVVFYDPQRR